MIVPQQVSTNVRIDCPCCGLFLLTETTADDLCDLDLDEITWTAMAFELRRMTDRNTPPVLKFDFLQNLAVRARIPTPDVLVDEAVIWLGKHSKYPGFSQDITYPAFKAVLGAVTPQAFNYMIECLRLSPYFRGIDTDTLVGASITDCTLTPAGWQQFRDLTHARTNSRFGFIAMKYNDHELDALVRDHFTPAVIQTGFALRRLDDQQPAGLIDDQLRTLIRTARFLVCDLTHGNRGAYWEAGFAEGLGRPVIYACQKAVFDDRQHEHYPHFDTNHLVTVIWDPADPAAAARKLKDTIRATLPAEADLED